MPSITTVFRKDKLNKKGQAPIHFRIIKHRKIRYISSGIMLDEKFWDNRNSKIKGTHPNSKRLNSYLSNKHTELQDKVFEYETHTKSLSSSRIKEHVMGKKPEDFFAFAEEVLQDYLNAGKIGTYDKNRAILGKLRIFLKGKSLDFQDITPRFLIKYEKYLRDDLGNSIGTIGNTLKFIRKVFNDAIRQDLVEIYQNPFLKYKIKTGKSQRVYLTEEELRAIEELNLVPGSRMELHRDMFVFAAYTGGIRVSDVLRLQWMDFDGTHIHVTIQKTKGQLSIKLPKKAIAIIKAQEGKSKRFIFPMLLDSIDLDDPLQVDRKISSGTAYINKNLKFIAEQASIKKKLSFHISRHTWATRALRKGISIDKVSKLMGHAAIKETQIYAKIVGEELDKAMEVFDN